MAYAFTPSRPTAIKTRVYSKLLSIPLSKEFLDWAQHLQIVSKDIGVVKFSPDLWYDSQWLFLEAVFCNPGIHWFVFLKGRQEGITTISLALDLFHSFRIKNLQVAMVSADYLISAGVRENLSTMYAHLPVEAKIKKRTDNAVRFSFWNGSVIKYLFLTMKQGKKGNMGRQGSHNYCHCTEVAYFPNLEDYNAFIRTLSDQFPQRLYIFESTANGYNQFNEMWEIAKESEEQAAVFLGWWTKETYRLEEPGQYGYNPVGWEKENMDLVKKMYGYEIDIHQLAWWRREAKEKISDRGMLTREDVALQEYPFTEHDAFRLSGKSFFNARQLQDQEENPVRPIRCWQPVLTNKPEETRFVESPAGSIKIYEDPEPRAQYILGADPSYGANPDSDNAVIEIYKAHQDKMIQVLEYCDNIVDTYHFTWILISLAGIWGAPQIIEVNGPGRAVLQQMDMFRTWIKEHDKEIDKKFTVFDYAKRLKSEYLWHRPDSLGTGYARHWLTTPDHKEQLMFQFQSAYHNREIVVRSPMLVKEMERVTRIGSDIRAETMKDTSGRQINDDRVIASALVCEFWTKFFRRRLLTYAEYEEQKKKETEEKTVYDNPQAAFMQHFIREIITSASVERKA